MARLGLLFVALYAGVGFAICLAIHVISFFAVPPAGEALIGGLGLAVFPPHMVVVSLIMRSIGGPRMIWGWGEFWDRALPDCPVWMRRIVLALWVYAFLAILFLFATAASVVKSDPTEAQFRGQAFLGGASAVLLLFYGFALVASITWLRRDPAKLLPRCANGHAVVLSDRFCPQCGVPLVKL